MSDNRFFINCREQGLHMSYEDAVRVRRIWIDTFKEMQQHMNPEEIKDSGQLAGYYDPDPQDGDEDDQDEQNDKRRFRATIINGMKRNRCSYCSALNIHFQGLTAYGAKLAMWNMAMAGLLPRMINFVHDEVIYWLWPDELKTVIPVVETCMIEGMRIACPHVKIGVETSCMWHWDKSKEGHVKYNDMQWADDGSPVIPEPKFVMEAYAGKA